jgi:hypothetical protein
LVLLAAGCYAPAVPGEVPCGEGDACPAGQVCDHGLSVPTCVDRLGDAGPADGNHVANDAPPPDGAPPPLPGDNVMRLSFDDDPTDGVLDSQGSHVATCTGDTCPAVVPGHIGGAYSFMADHIVVTDAADLHPNQGFTAAAWIEPAAGQEMMILCKHYFTVAESYALSLRGNNQPRLRFSGPSTGLGSMASMTRDAWHHVAVTWDGATARLYIDGAASGSELLPALGADSGVTEIGACHGEKTFSGAIDDVQFYSRPLTEAEIAILAGY